MYSPKVHVPEALISTLWVRKGTVTFPFWKNAMVNRFEGGGKPYIFSRFQIKKTSSIKRQKKEIAPAAQKKKYFCPKKSIVPITTQNSFNSNTQLNNYMVNRFGGQTIEFLKMEKWLFPKHLAVLSIQVFSMIAPKYFFAKRCITYYLLRTQ